MRTKLKAFTADIYRVRKYKKAYKVYRTARGWAITIHKAYWYFNTGKPFHKTALAVVDIRGEESVETRYIRLAPKASSSKRPVRSWAVTYSRLLQREAA